MDKLLPASTLVRLRDVSKTVSASDTDIRNQRVRDANGRALGRVDALFIDGTKDEVRYLEVVSGGFWGMGQSRFLIPVELVDVIVAGEVWLTGSTPPLSEEHPYNPEIIIDPALYAGEYDYYGLVPWWDNTSLPPSRPPRRKRGRNRRAF